MKYIAEFLVTESRQKWVKIPCDGWSDAVEKMEQMTKNSEIEFGDAPFEQDYLFNEIEFVHKD
ncbi:MAG: hypothetical protein HUK20_13090 [Fibrobacter sp.]|nr:hypothetical protein [Fibrobacter sp.]